MPAAAPTAASAAGSNRISQGKGRTSNTQPSTNSVKIKNRVADFRTMGPSHDGLTGRVDGGR